MYLTDATKTALETALKRKTDELSKMDMKDEVAFIKDVTGHAPYFSKNMDSRMQGRGNPLISRRRICTLQDVNQWIARLDNNG